jgi:hypothetical protein
MGAAADDCGDDGGGNGFSHDGVLVDQASLASSGRLGGLSSTVRSAVRIN